MFCLIEDAIKKNDLEKISAVITDNASEMVYAGEKIEQKYESIVHIRCFCHIVHLLIGKVLSCSIIRKQLQESNEIVSCVKNRNVVHSAFCRIKGTVQDD